MEMFKVLKFGSKLTYQEKEDLPDSAYAVVYTDPKTGKKERKYVIKDEAHVRDALSRFSAFKENLPPGVRAKAARRIYEAAKRFGIEISEDNPIRKYVGKSAEKLSYQEKKSLPDSVFAVLYKDPRTGEKVREYPLHDAQHVRTAIGYWAKNYKNVPPEIRPQAARKIYEAAKKYGIEVNEETILKYVGKINKQKAAEYIDFLLNHPKIKSNENWILGLKLAKRQLYEKTAEALDAVQSIEITSGVWDDPVILMRYGGDIFNYAGVPVLEKLSEAPSVEIDDLAVSPSEIKDAVNHEEVKGVVLASTINAIKNAKTPEELQDIVNELAPDVKELLKQIIGQERIHKNPIEL